MAMLLLRASCPPPLKGPAKLFKIAPGDFVDESCKRPPRMAEVSILQEHHIDLTH